MLAGEAVAPHPHQGGKFDVDRIESAAKAMLDGLGECRAAIEALCEVTP